jgi:hypothetical protein
MSDLAQKTEATVRSFSNKYNEGTRRSQQVFEETNSAENRHPIVEAFKAGRARDIADEPKAGKAPCFVLGSGASLDDTLPKMKGWQGGIICSTSQALTLMYHGIEPTHIVCLDPFSMWDEIKGVDWSKTRTKLVLQPGILPDLVAKWPNEMLLYILDNGKPDSYYATTMKRQYTWREGPVRTPTFHYYIRTAITIFACSPPMQMFVADILGYGTIFLAGMNWSEYKGKRRSTEYTCEDGKWTAHPNLYETGPDEVISNNGRKTRPMHLYYKKNTISAWRLSHQTCYNTDEMGILTEVPYTSIMKVMQKKGLNYPTQSHAMIDRITERYLASVGAYVIVTDKGISFVESENPTVDLPDFMRKIMGRYRCDKCGVEYTIGKIASPEAVESFIEAVKIQKLDAVKHMETLVSGAVAGALAGSFDRDDDRDHNGEPCDRCKEGKLRRVIEVNIEGNMRRINSEIALAKARAALP